VQDSTQVLVLSQRFPPELGAAANRLGAVARAFADAGWQVTVVTQFPNYPHGVIACGYQGSLFRSERSHGIRVLRVRPLLPSKKGILARTISELHYSLASMIVGLFQSTNVVYVTSPTMFAVFPALLLAKVKQAILVWEIRDLTWRYARELGKVRSQNLVVALETILIRTARRVDRLVVTTAEQREYFVRAGVEQNRITVVPNGVDRELFVVDGAGADASQSRKTRVMYGGLIGYPQGLGVLLDVAELLRDETDVEFVLLGEGPEKTALVKAAAERGLTNVQFWGAVPRNEYLRLCSQATILFAHLRRLDSLRTALPSKLLEYMALGRPIIFAGEGVGANLVREAECGVVVPPEQPLAIRDAVQRLHSDALLREQMGTRGRQFVTQHYDRTILLGEMVRDIESLVR